jgi:hypothetical protein
MLEIRPTCENGKKALPPDSLEARICDELRSPSHPVLGAPDLIWINGRKNDLE